LAATASAVAQRGRPAYRPPPRLPTPRIEIPRYQPPRWEPPRTIHPWDRPTTPRYPWNTPAAPRYPWERPAPFSEAELRLKALDNHRSSGSSRVIPDPAAALKELSGTVLVPDSMKRLGYRPTVNDILGLKTVQLPAQERARLARSAARNLAESARKELERPE